VAHPADENSLADRHYVTLILRLTLDRGGRLIQGELVDTTDSQLARFIGVTGLNQAVQDWLMRYEHDKMKA
jgi:hypothetical protein